MVGGVTGGGGGVRKERFGGPHSRRCTHKAVHTQGGQWPLQESCYVGGVQGLAWNDHRLGSLWGHWGPPAFAAQPKTIQKGGSKTKHTNRLTHLASTNPLIGYGVVSSHRAWCR